jgi:hypothetical protein
MTLPQNITDHLHVIGDATAARNFIVELTTGRIESGIESPKVSVWDQILEELNEKTYQPTLQETGSKLQAANATTKYLKLLKKTHPQLKLLMSMKHDVELKEPKIFVPRLTKSALDYKDYDMASARVWIDAYIEWASYWVPEAPREWHEIVALWAIAVLVERRVLITGSGSPIVTSFYLLLLGDSGTGKSRSIEKAQELLNKISGLGNELIRTGNITSQKMIQDADGKVPHDWDDLSEARKAKETRRLIHCAYRALFTDEFGPKLNQISSPNANSAMSGLLDIFLKWITGYGTGQETLTSDNSEGGPRYFCFAGGAVPMNFEKQGHGSSVWVSGLIARFFIGYSDKKPTGRPPIGNCEVPDALSIPLRLLNDNLGIREAEVVEVPQTEEQRHRRVKKEFRVIRYDPEPLCLELKEGSEVAMAFQDYREEILDLSYEESVPVQLQASYRRLAERCLRLAALVALSAHGSDAVWCQNPKIEMKHWAVAHQITERERYNLHECYETVFAGDKTIIRQHEDRVMSVMKRMAGTWIELSRLKHSYLKTLDTKLISDILQRAEVEREVISCQRPNRKSKGNTITVWSLVGTPPPEDAIGYPEWAIEDVMIEED